TDDQPRQGALPSVDAGSLRSRCVLPEISGRNRHLHDQAKTRRLCPQPFLPQPVPRPAIDGPHPQRHDSLAKVGFLQSLPDTFSFPVLANALAWSIKNAINAFFTVPSYSTVNENALQTIRET